MSRKLKPAKRTPLAPALRTPVVTAAARGPALGERRSQRLLAAGS